MIFTFRKLKIFKVINSKDKMKTMPNINRSWEKCQIFKNRFKMFNLKFWVSKNQMKILFLQNNSLKKYNSNSKRKNS